VLLLHPNTNPNMADALDGTTPLLAAASAGHTDVVFFCSSSSFELPFY
jgi:nucleoside-diphosphate-sugar epimerase